MAVLNPVTLTFSQGDDVAFPIKFYEPDGITPTNKSNCTYQGFIRDTFDGPVIATFTFTYTNLSIGQMVMKLTNSVTEAIEVPLTRKLFVFDVEETNSTGQKQKVLSGNIQVLREVTRNG